MDPGVLNPIPRVPTCVTNPGVLNPIPRVPTCVTNPGVTNAAVPNSGTASARAS
jgi:hypothetical protein